MPYTPFSELPARARLWVFIADRAVADAAPVLDAVDAHLSQWAAHGVPLVCARDWRENQFLAIAVDEAATGASGCSIDGLFRTISRAQTQVGADFLASGRIAWRAANGEVRVSTRAEFESLVASGSVSAETPVFETLIGNVGEWRDQFERRAAESWVSDLM